MEILSATASNCAYIKDLGVADMNTEVIIIFEVNELVAKAWILCDSSKNNFLLVSLGAYPIVATTICAFAF